MEKECCQEIQLALWGLVAIEINGNYIQEEIWDMKQLVGFLLLKCHNVPGV